MAQIGNRHSKQHKMKTQQPRADGMHTHHILSTTTMYHLDAVKQSQTQQSPWSTMKCSQLAAWTTNRSLHVASSVKAFPGRQAKTGSTLPRAAHLDDDVIGCQQCITSHSGNTPAYPDMQDKTFGFVLQAYRS